MIDWEMFRPILERIDAKERKSAAGRKPLCRVVMFKLLILQRLHNLSDERLQFQVTDRLSFMRFLGLDPEPVSTSLIESRFAAGRCCPHCRSEQAIRYGHANGMHRYRCKMCRHTFNALTGTPLNRLHKRGLWLRQAEALAGVTEVDETYFLLSFKGKRTLPRKARKCGGQAAKRGLSHEQVPVLIARDRAGVTADCMPKTSDAATLAAALKPFVPADGVLCSDGSPALAGAARALGVEHRSINLSAGIRVDGPWHIQNVNAYHSRLKAWIAKFRGVATRYLANYLGWFRAHDRASGNGLKPAQWLAMAVGVSS